MPEASSRRALTIALAAAGVLLIAGGLYVAFWRPRTALWVVLALVMFCGGVALASQAIDVGREKLERRIGRRAIALATAALALLATLMGLISTTTSSSGKDSGGGLPTFAATVEPGDPGQALRRFFYDNDGRAAFLDLRFDHQQFLSPDDPALYDNSVHGEIDSTSDPSVIQITVPSPCDSDCHPGATDIPGDQLVLNLPPVPGPRLQRHRGRHPDPGDLLGGVRGEPHGKRRIRARRAAPGGPGAVTPTKLRGAGQPSMPRAARRAGRSAAPKTTRLRVAT